MKVAILSMQRIVNMGSVLQAYSLREMVQEISGAEVDFLDIEDTPALESRKTVKDSEDYKSPAVYSQKILQRGKRWMISRLSACSKAQIRRFMKEELHLDAQNSRKAYDYVIVGSDEVFNHAKGIRLQLHGEISQGRKLFTYAASCGSALPEDIEMEDVTAIRKAMSRFSAVSVRDRKTREYVSGLYGGKIEHHLDPVLTGNLYKRTPKRVPLKKYLLVYAYGQRIRTAEEIDAIKAFAKAKGLKTVAIGGSQFWCDLYIPLSPMRALDYFAHAEYVVTDTFHGTIFSVINHKKFAVIMRTTNCGKISSLLEDLGLESRKIGQMDMLGSVLSEEIRYDRVDEILKRERMRARAYLQEQLKG